MYNKVKIATSVLENPNLFTHTAPHHADEIFATAMLSFILEPVVLRTRDEEILKEADGIVYDVGSEYDILNARFDHHQLEFNKVREDGIKFSSAGLIWEAFGHDILRSMDCEERNIVEVASIVDSELVRGIDANDNGQLGKPEEMTLSTAIATFNRNWDEVEDEVDSSFLRACYIAQEVLYHEIKRAISRVKGKAIIREKIENAEDKILILDKFIGGWIEEVLKSDILSARELLFGVYQGQDKNWCIRAIPPTGAELMKQRKSFPKEWRGLKGEMLSKACEVENSVFCHKDGFFAVAKTKEAALEMAKKACM
jgi:MYG1 family protein